MEEPNKNPGGSESATPCPWGALRYFQSHEEITKTRHNLPHWQQEGACYFVTFRLADSLPEALLAPWRELRAAWIALNPKPWDVATEMEYHRRFSREIDERLDEGHGSCLLKDPGNARIVADALGFFDRDRYLMHAWVVMPNHVHALFSLAADSLLEKQISSWKRFSTKEIHRLAGGSGAFWQEDYFDRMIRDSEHFGNVARYIAKNPAKLRNGTYLAYQAPWV